jgi:hypothetical protein
LKPVLKSVFKPVLKPVLKLGSAWFHRLKRQFDELLSRFDFTFNLHRYVKGVDMMASATIDADYRAGGNSTALNSTITLEFEVNAWPFAPNKTTGALGGAATATSTSAPLGESDYHKVGRCTLKPIETRVDSAWRGGAS